MIRTASIQPKSGQHPRNPLRRKPQRWLQRQPVLISREVAPPALALFVDPHCVGRHELISVAAGRAQTILLDRYRDGVAQICKHVTGRRPFAGLLIAAGEDAASISIGSTRLTVPGLYAYEDQLRLIGRTLAGGAAIRLLGRGRNAPNDEILVAMLSKLTGVDVLSSGMPPHLDEVWTSLASAYPASLHVRACSDDRRSRPSEAMVPAASCPD